MISFEPVMIQQKDLKPENTEKLNAMKEVYTIKYQNMLDDLK